MRPNDLLADETTAAASATSAATSSPSVSRKVPVTNEEVSTWDNVQTRDRGDSKRGSMRDYFRKVNTSDVVETEKLTQLSSVNETEPTTTAKPAFKMRFAQQSQASTTPKRGDGGAPAPQASADLQKMLGHVVQQLDMVMSTLTLFERRMGLYEARVAHIEDALVSSDDEEVRRYVILL